MNEIILVDLYYIVYVINFSICRSIKGDNTWYREQRGIEEEDKTIEPS